MFKNAEEIRNAVDNGRIVHWANNSYTVKKSGNEYNIVCEQNNNVIGLTWHDGVTLNGELWDFYDEYSTPLGDLPPCSDINGPEPVHNREDMLLNEIRFLRNKLQEAAGVPMNQSWDYPRSYVKK